MVTLASAMSRNEEERAQLVSCLARSGIVSINRIAVCPSIVSGQASAIVVSEFNDHIVAGLNNFCNSVKSAFTSEAACRASTNCVVDNRETDVVRKVCSPSCSVCESKHKTKETKARTCRRTVISTCLGHCRVSSEIDSLR